MQIVQPPCLSCRLFNRHVCHADCSTAMFVMQIVYQ
jgi:hypothetical protein